MTGLRVTACPMFYEASAFDQDLGWCVDDDGPGALLDPCVSTPRALVRSA